MAGNHKTSASTTSGSTSVSLGTFSPSLTTDIENAPSGIVADIIGVAKSIAKQDNLSTGQTTELERTSLATSAIETGGTFSPTSVGDPNKQGQYTSFGLFQLHEGGELGDVPGTTLSDQIANANNPITNASVAIKKIAAVLIGSPNASPGTIAATAQAPADQTGYASDVNADLENTSAFNVKTLGSANQVSVNVPDSIKATTSGGPGASGSATTAGDSSSSSSLTGILAKVGAFLLGLVLVGVGLFILFQQDAPPVTKAASKA